MDKHSTRPTPPDDGATYFRHLCDSAGVGLLSFDDHLVVQYCNCQAAILLGVDATALVGQTVCQVFPQEQANTVERLARRALEQHECGEFELQHRGPDGAGQRYLAFTISPICNEQGIGSGASACVRDITRRIHLQERLGQDRKMRALGSLAGSVAHHFNNILGGIVTSVDFAKQSNDTRLLRKTLNNTAEALQRASDLLDGLLAFAEADYRDQDLADLTESMLCFVNEIEADLTRHGIALELQLSKVPVLAVPRKRFIMVMQNVVNNAIDAMPEGGRLKIDMTAGVEEVICRVTDSGPGISGQEIERVFEPFYSTKRSSGHPGGSAHHGLGLSVAMGLVHELGGSISISSVSGHSTAVEIRLPVDPSRPVPPSAQPAEPFVPFP